METTTDRAAVAAAAADDFRRHAQMLDAQVHSTNTVPVVTDISPWHPAAKPDNYEAAIRELQGNMMMLFRDVARQGKQIAALAERIARLEQAQAGGGADG